MSQVHIVTDSTSDIPAALAEELGIAVVPCQVVFGNDVYLDGVDLSPTEFYAKLAQTRELPRTSQPPVGLFADAYRRILEDDGSAEIVSIHVTGKLSGTVNAAWAGAQMLPDPSRVSVIDSGQLSMGLGWAVIEAARLAQAGAPRSEIRHSTQTLLPRLRVAAIIDTLDSLYRGGRINQLMAVLGTALRIKPLLTVRDGEVSVMGQVRTRSRALKHLAVVVREWGPLARMAILHTDAPWVAQTLAEDLADLMPADETIMGPVGPALTAHLGVGVVGICALLEGG
jgi:DegV family protein with EDD domain